ncbi:MAG: AbrB/MazE/SpoVT family DNA-binding domain-containing protein [Candidatus Bathyarchaeota archaeon]|nr:AbrB/MazE/SpoVT family DNA-binding domain-containing protein [Candidatus Bathyarchaeota archaeon]
MGNVKELSVDDKGRLQLSKDIRKKLGIKGRGKVKVIVEDQEVIITAPMPREEFIEYMNGFIKGGKPPVDPLSLKKIWGQPKR